MTSDLGLAARRIATVPKRPSREFRGAAALSIAGLLVLLFLSVTAWSLSIVPPIARHLAVVTPLVLAILHIAVAFGLAAELHWARRAVTPLLVLAVISGVVQVIAGVVRGSLEIPIAGLLALWALRAPAAAALPARGIPLAAWAVVGLAGLLTASPLLRPLILAPGGPLLTQASDLELAVSWSPGCVDTTTDTTEVPTGISPEIVDVTVDWRWKRAEPLREGMDTLTLEWGTIAALEDYGYYQRLDDHLPPGIDLADASFTERRYTIDLAVRGFEPGSVTVRLYRPHQGAAPPGGSIELYVSYAHAPNGEVGPARSVVWAQGMQARCEW